MIGLAAALLLALILVIIALVKVEIKENDMKRKFFIWERWKIVRESIVKRFDKLNEIIVEQDFLEQEMRIDRRA